MDLPASVVALGEQLRGTEKISPDPALLCDPDVFAAERTRIFMQPLLAVDHATRLSEDGHYFRCDAAPRSLVVTRENGGRLHALRNVCIHAGYPVCEAADGPAERLVCLYHGWEYALDGRLVEPGALLPDRPVAAASDRVSGANSQWVDSGRSFGKSKPGRATYRWAS